MTCDKGSFASASIVNDDVAVYGEKVQLRSMKNLNPWSVISQFKLAGNLL